MSQGIGVLQSSNLPCSISSIGAYFSPGQQGVQPCMRLYVHANVRVYLRIRVCACASTGVRVCARMQLFTYRCTQCREEVDEARNAANNKKCTCECTCELIDRVTHSNQLTRHFTRRICFGGTNAQDERNPQNESQRCCAKYIL